MKVRRSSENQKVKQITNERWELTEEELKETSRQQSRKQKGVVGFVFFRLTGPMVVEAKREVPDPNSYCSLPNTLLYRERIQCLLVKKNIILN